MWCLVYHSLLWQSVISWNDTDVLHFRLERNGQEMFDQWWTTYIVKNARIEYVLLDALQGFWNNFERPNPVIKANSRQRWGHPVSHSLINWWKNGPSHQLDFSEALKHRHPSSRSKNSAICSFKYGDHIPIEEWGPGPLQQLHPALDPSTLLSPV